MINSKDQNYNASKLTIAPLNSTPDLGANQHSAPNSYKKPHLLQRIGLATSLAVALFTAPTIFESTPVQAANLGDLFGGSTSSQQQDFLKVEDAFSVGAVQQGKKVRVSIEITPGHYVYKDKLKLKLPEGITASDFEFSHSSTTVDDPIFGKVAVFKQPSLTATAVLKNTTSKAINQEATLIWQGCAEAGLCYPPQREVLTINLGADKSAQSSTSATSKVATSSAKTEPKSKAVDNNQDNLANKSSEKLKAASEAATGGPSTVATSAPQSTRSNNTTLQGSTQVVASASQSDNQPESSNASIATDDQFGTDTLNTTDERIEDGQHVSASTGQLSDSNQQQNARGSLFGSENIVNQDPFGLAKHPWLALLLLFLAGLGLAFTPCVLPMLPIVSNIVARQHTPTAKKGLILSGSYALGVAIAYGLLGAVIAIFGQSLGIIGWLQNPVILLVFAAVFVVLALYMLDAFRIPVPNAIRQRTQAMSQVGDKYLGSTFGSFIAGLLSALVVSPCVSAPLFGALLAVSTIGNPLLGFAALFMLGFGLSAPLMLLGASQGNLMPKAGEWMNWVKQGFALLLFAVALLLVERVLISPIMLMLWAVWFMIVAVWAWSWAGRGTLFTKPLAIILAVWSTVTMIGAAAGSHDVWQPLQIFTRNSGLDNRALNATQLQMGAASSVLQSMNTGNSIALQGAGHQASDLHITTIDELVDIIEHTPKVLVDVTAEWCIECRIMDKTLFTNRPVAMQGWQLVRLDVTETNAESERVLSELRLFGPPALLYIVDGELKIQQVGEIGRSEFEQTLASL